MVTETKAISARVKRIQELIEEYADCRDELDPYKIAVEIDAMYQEEVTIAENMRDFWKHQASGAER